MTTSFRRQPKVSSATLILTSFFLIIGGLLPMIEPSAGTTAAPSTHFVWFNFAGMSDPALAGRFKFLLIYPIFAGVLVTVVSLFAFGLARQLLVIFAGIIPIFALVRDGGVRQMFGALSGIFTAGHGVGSVTGWAAWMGLFVGAFGLLHCKQAKNLAQIGGAGAALWCLALILPTGPEGHTHVAIAQPFVLMLSDPATVGIAGPRWAAVLMGVTQILGMFFVTLAAMKALQMTLAQQTNGKGAAAALSFLGVAAGFWFMGSVLAAWAMYPTDVLLPTNYPGLAMAVVKLSLWWFGLFLLIPMGLADFALSFAPMVEIAPRRRATPLEQPSAVIP